MSYGVSYEFMGQADIQVGEDRAQVCVGAFATEGSLIDHVVSPHTVLVVECSERIALNVLLNRVGASDAKRLFNNRFDFFGGFVVGIEKIRWYVVNHNVRL